MDTRKFSDLKEFYYSAQAAQAETIIVCYTDEWGPKTLEDNSVYCGPLQEAALLAYKDGIIFSCKLSGEAADRKLLQQDIKAHGFQWQERERNQGKYGS